MHEKWGKKGILKPKLALTLPLEFALLLKSPRKDKEGVSLVEQCVCVCVFWVKETTEKGKCFLEQCSK